jgi:hypothetical protein
MQRVLYWSMHPTGARRKPEWSCRNRLRDLRSIVRFPILNKSCDPTGDKIDRSIPTGQPGGGTARPGGRTGTANFGNSGPNLKMQPGRVFQE